MANIRDTVVFNRAERFVEGWHWVLPAADLRRKQVKAVRILGRDLVVYRGEGGVARILDAHCPHMGAHLSQGRVEGDALRCFFHAWKFDGTGRCVEAPCVQPPPRASLRPWPTAEHLGLIWVWAGDSEPGELPHVPELRGEECDYLLGTHFVKGCHPNVVLINAIDENHFNSVHRLPVELYMKTEAVSANAQTFANTTRVPTTNALTRFIGRFYEGALTYALSYHYGATGTVTLGPDAFHFHIMFALRLVEGGKAEGQTVLVTKKRRGVGGAAFNRAVLEATQVVGDYFAHGDTMVFETIRFDFKTPTKADHAIVDFIEHIERQPVRAWGSWDAVPRGRAPVRLEVYAGERARDD